MFGLVKLLKLTGTVEHGDIDFHLERLYRAYFFVFLSTILCKRLISDLDTL